MTFRKMTSILTIGALVASMGTAVFAEDMDSTQSSDPVVASTPADSSAASEKKVDKGSTNKNKIKSSNAKYTKDELKLLKKIESILKKQPGIKIVPVDKILGDNGAVKVDMPVAIKKGIIYMSPETMGKVFGADIAYDSSAKKIVITKGDTKVELAVGKGMVKINGKQEKLDSNAISAGGKVLIPVTKIAKALQVKVIYRPDTNTLVIKSKSKSSTPQAPAVQAPAETQSTPPAQTPAETPQAPSSQTATEGPTATVN